MSHKKKFFVLVSYLTKINDQALPYPRRDENSQHHDSFKLEMDTLLCTLFNKVERISTSTHPTTET
jgi:hypothetical protein